MQTRIDLKLQLEGLRTTRDALEFWQRNRMRFQKEDSWLVLSSQDGALKQQPVVELGRMGRLISCFEGERLVFMDDSVASQTVERGNASLGVDYEIFFDTNAASLLRRLVEGKEDEHVGDLHNFLRKTGGGSINWNHLLYLHENRAAVLKNERLDDVFATIEASEQLDSLDRAHFLETGEWRLLCSREECRQRAVEALGNWHRQLSSGAPSPFDLYDSIFQCAVLKMALIQFASPSPQKAARKFAEFITFLHEALACISIELGWCAWQLFSGAAAGKTFFAKLQLNNPNLQKWCANLAMDLSHWHWFQTASSARGRQGSFMLPYFLTFDGGMRDLLVGLQWRAALLLSIAQPLPIHAFDAEALFIDNCGTELDPEKIFSLEATILRDQRRPDAAAIDQLRASLERELLANVA